MKQIIRLTESDLHNIVMEAVNKILAEDGTALGGTSSFSVNSPAGSGLGGSDPTGQAHNRIDVPISAPLKQKHNLGKMDDFYKDSLKRNDDEKNHSISMNRIGENTEKKVDEAVDEGIGNWLKGAAVGGMMAMSPMQANAQTQNYQPQQNDSIQTQMQQAQKLTSQDLMKMFPQAYKDRNANAKVWFKNQKKYVADVNGKISLVGKIAASRGQNPWDALLQKYCPEEYDSKIFSLSDFDIQ